VWLVKLALDTLDVTTHEERSSDAQYLSIGRVSIFRGGRGYTPTDEDEFHPVDLDNSVKTCDVQVCTCR
jgi:hypothetical protein